MHDGYMAPPAFTRCLTSTSPRGWRPTTCMPRLQRYLGCGYIWAAAWKRSLSAATLARPCAAPAAHLAAVCRGATLRHIQDGLAGLGVHAVVMLQARMGGQY